MRAQGSRSAYNIRMVSFDGCTTGSCPTPREPQHFPNKVSFSIPLSFNIKNVPFCHNPQSAARKVDTRSPAAKNNSTMRVGTRRNSVEGFQDSFIPIPQTTQMLHGGYGNYRINCLKKTVHLNSQAGFSLPQPQSEFMKRFSAMASASQGN